MWDGECEGRGRGEEGGIERAADNTSCLSLSFSHNASRNKTTPPHVRASPSHCREELAVEVMAGIESRWPAGVALPSSATDGAHVMLSLMLRASFWSSLCCFAPLQSTSLPA